MRWTIALVLGLVGAAACADELELRAGRTPPQGKIYAVSLAGVIVEDPFGVQRTIRWDSVRRITGDKAQDALVYEPIAVDSWRARSRLERGDAVTAEPLFEQLFDRYEGSQSEMASMVAEGLLRCRLRRSAHTAAVTPWLAYLTSEGNGPYRSLIVGVLRPAVDPETGLVPSLAPVWLATPAVEAFANADEIVAWSATDASPPRRAEILGRLYRHAAQFEVGLVEGTPELDLDSREQRDPGIQLALSIILARCGDTQQRADARATLLDIMNAEARVPVARQRMWIEAWCRLGIGRSLLMETDRETRLSGIVELLHLPARFGESLPYLAGLALAECAVALDQHADPRSLNALLSEIRNQYASHAATQWAPLQQLLMQHTRALPLPLREETR